MEKEEERPNKRRFPCDETGCEFSANRKDQLSNHKKQKHTGDEAKVFVCDFEGCLGRFKMKYHLQRHKSLKHGQGSKYFVCTADACPFKAKARQTLQTHQRLIHGIGAQLFVCEIDGCVETAKSKANLKYHQIHAHGFGAQDLVCGLGGCKTVTKTPTDLKSHQKHVHGISAKVFSCGIGDCKKTAKTSASIKTHQRLIHGAGNVLEFPCDVQDCTFKTKIVGNLKKHKSRVHDIGDKECQMRIHNVYKLISYTDPQFGQVLQICRECFNKTTGHKTRVELIMVQFLKKQIDSPMILHNQRVHGDACTTYRPDVVYASPGLTLCIECDEHEHLWENGTYQCDETRMSRLAEETSHNRVIFLRLNPHSYKAPPGEPKLSQNARVTLLVQTYHWICGIHDQLPFLFVIYIGYSPGNPRIALCIPKLMVYSDRDLNLDKVQMAAK
jgi:hypothetical protein